MSVQDDLVHPDQILAAANFVPETNRYWFIIFDILIYVHDMWIKIILSFRSSLLEFYCGGLFIRSRVGTRLFGGDTNSLSFIVSFWFVAVAVPSGG